MKLTLVLFVSIYCSTGSYAQIAPDGKSTTSATKKNETNPVFGDISLGDPYKIVAEKLRKSSLLELTVNESYLGRFGLNDSYRTKKTIGGLKCLLQFDWDDGNNLRELSMQTQPQPVSAYSGAVKDTWSELINLMSALQGKPLQAAAYPQATLLQDDMSLSTHLWRLADGGTGLAGVSKSSVGYMVSVRFTSERIEPTTVRR